MSTKYGIYSETAHALHGVATWMTPEGDHVYVTCVSDERHAPGYNFPDKKCLGPVVKCVRPNLQRKSRAPAYRTPHQLLKTTPTAFTFIRWPERSPSMPHKHGFYSAEAVKAGHGSSIWATPDGEEREITGTVGDEEGSAYLWSDKVYVGVVTHHLREKVRPKSSQRPITSP